MPRRDALLVLISIAAYLAASLAWLSLPGPQYDEVIFLAASYPEDPVTSRAGDIQLFGRKTPIMLLPYLGALKGLLWRALFAVWPPSIYSVRVPAVLLGAAALVLFYLWAGRFYGGGIALAALALAATDPTYIFTARTDLTVVLQHLFRWGGMLMGTLWLQGVWLKNERRLWLLAGAGFCFGLGLWDKVTFLWFLLALGATLLILFPGEVRRRWRRWRPLPAVVFVVALTAGSLPLVVYNLRGPGAGTGRVARLDDLAGPTLAGKLGVLGTTLDARFVYRWMGGRIVESNTSSVYSDRTQLALDAASLFGPASGTLLPWAIAAALIVTVVAAGERRPLLFPLLASVLMWLQMLPLAQSGGGAHHYVLAYPLPHLAVAACGAWLWQRASHWGRRSLGLALALLLATNMGWSARYLGAFRQTGGIGPWSDAIYDVSDYLRRQPPALLVNMDWGFSMPLLLLNGGRVPQDDFYSVVAFGNSAATGSHVEQLLPFFQRPGSLFLFHHETRDIFPQVREVFELALDKAQMQAVPVRTFYQRDGEPSAMLFAVQPGRAAPVPQGPPVSLWLDPAEVSPGGSYVIICRELAGKAIDVRVLIRKRTPFVAMRFCVLDATGRAIIPVPMLSEPGTFEVVGVRVTGTFEWRPTSAFITVR